MNDTNKRFRTVPAVPVEKPERWADLKEGQFFIWERENEVLVICRVPANRDEGGYPVDSLRVSGDFPGSPTWTWNGDREKPNLDPSILIYGPDGQTVIWHGYLRNGYWEAAE